MAKRVVPELLELAQEVIAVVRQPLQLLEIQDHRLLCDEGQNQLEEIAPFVDAHPPVVQAGFRVGIQPRKARRDLSSPRTRIGFLNSPAVRLQSFEFQYPMLPEELLDELRFTYPPPAVDHNDRGFRRRIDVCKLLPIPAAADKAWVFTYGVVLHR